MFRRTVLKRASESLLPDMAKGAWRVENRHLAGVAVGICSVALLLRTEMKEQRSEMIQSIGELRKELRIEVRGLAAEIRSSLAELNSSRGAMDAHAQFFRDANAGKEGAPPR